MKDCDTVIEIQDLYICTQQKEKEKKKITKKKTLSQS